MSKNVGVYISLGGAALLCALIFGIPLITSKHKGSGRDAPAKAYDSGMVSLRVSVVDANSGDEIDNSKLSIEFIEGNKADGSQTVASKQRVQYVPRPLELSAKIDGPLSVSIGAPGYEPEYILIDPTAAPTMDKFVRIVRLKRVP